MSDSEGSSVELSWDEVQEFCLNGVSVAVEEVVNQTREGAAEVVNKSVDEAAGFLDKFEC